MCLSGEQIAIASGPHRAVVASVGATLRSYSVADRLVLDGFDADQVCPDARGLLNALDARTRSRASGSWLAL
jgi:aldose 1-epimerase